MHFAQLGDLACQVYAQQLNGVQGQSDALSVGQVLPEPNLNKQDLL